MRDHHEILAQFWRQLADSPLVMLGLSTAHSEPMVARFDREVPNTLFFCTSRDNRLVQGLATVSPRAMVHFASRDKGLCACLEGRLGACYDRSLGRRFWPEAAARSETPPGDLRQVQVLRFEIDNAELWRADPARACGPRRLFGGHLDRGIPDRGPQQAPF